jgi:methionine biosynthesis protein MetW
LLGELAVPLGELRFEARPAGFRYVEEHDRRPEHGRIVLEGRTGTSGRGGVTIDHGLLVATPGGDQRHGGAVVTETGDWNSVHFLASLLVPPGADVLDVGCGSGRAATRLLRSGCSVVGVEYDKERVAAAEDAGIEVILTDLEQDDALEPLADRQFDVVLCLDVLEHLRDPAPVLRRASELLKPTGVVIISIPNMTHGAVRVAMLEGRIERTDEGLLDRTHLYLYDRKAVDDLCRAAGVEVLERLSLRRQLEQTEIPVDIERVPDAVRTIIDRDPDAAVYQFLYVACVDRATVSWPRPHPAVEFIERSQSAEEVIRSVTADVRRRLREQDEELERARAQLRAYEEHLRLRLEAEKAEKAERKDLLDRLAAEQAAGADVLRRLHLEEDERAALAAALESEQSSAAGVRAERDRAVAELARARPAVERLEALRRSPVLRVYRLARRLYRRLVR